MARPEDIELRKVLRNDRLCRITYRASDPSGGEEANVGAVHLYTLNLMASDFVTKTATHVRDLNVTTQNVVSTMCNAMIHLQTPPQGKKLPPAEYNVRNAHEIPLRDATVRFSVKFDIEIIPTAKRDSTSARLVAGYRLSWLVQDLGTPDEHERNLENADEDQQTQRRRALPQYKKALERLNMKARESPLTLGLERSFYEASLIQEQIKVNRDRFVTSNKRALGNISVYSAAATEVATPEDLLGYRYARFRSMAAFITNGVQPYFLAHPSPSESTLPDDDEHAGFLRIHFDEQSLAQLHQDNPDPYPYTSATSPMNPDNMFCLERGVAYRVRTNPVPIDDKCCRLDSYFPLRNRGNMAPPPPRPVTPRRQPVVEDDDSEDDSAVADAGEDDDENSLNFSRSERMSPSASPEPDSVEDSPRPSAARLPRPSNPQEANEDDMELEQAEPIPLPSLREYFRADGERIHPVAPRPNKPYPHLVSTVNLNASFAEFFIPAAPLPAPLGHSIDADYFNTDEPSPEEAAENLFLYEFEKFDPIALTEALNATERLRRVEEITGPVQNAAPQNAGQGNSRASVKLRRDYVPLLDTTVPATLTDAISGATNPLLQLRPGETEEQRDERIGRHGTPKSLMPVKIRQEHLVRQKLSELAERFAQRRYLELAASYHKQTEPPASDTFIPFADFLPQTKATEVRISYVEQNRRHLEELADEAFEMAGVTLDAKEKRKVTDQIESLEPWKIDRCFHLELRSRFQMEKVTLNVTNEKVNKQLEERILTNNVPKNKIDTMFAERAMAECEDRRALLTRQGELFFRTTLTTERLSPANIAIRNYIKSEILPNRNTPNLIKPRLNARPYVTFRQRHLDAYRSTEFVSKQNAPYMEQAHICGFHALRFGLRRTKPALNLLFAGGTGSGKSFCLNIIENLAPKGVVSNTTQATDKAYNVDQDFDGHVFLFEEMESALLFSNKNKNDTGSTDKINFAKARMTAFMTTAIYFDKDDDQNKRVQRTCNSSCHSITCGATNQFLAAMDQPMARRFMINFISEAAIEVDGNTPADLDPISVSTASASALEAKRRGFREIFAAYGLCEMAIKAGWFEDVAVEGGKLVLSSILAHARNEQGIAAVSDTKRYWLLEIARILSLEYACDMGLNSLVAAYVYKTCPDIKRWESSGFLHMIAPRFFVLKEAVGHACTLFDFLIGTRDENQLLATILLDLMHVNDPARCTYAKELNAHGEEVEDFNNFAVFGASAKQLYKRIAEKHKQSGVYYRPEDITAMFVPYMKMYSTTGRFTGVRDAQTSRVKLSRVDDADLTDERAAMAVETESELRGRNKTQFKISVEFVANRFGLDFTQDSAETITQRLREAIPVLENLDIFTDPAQREQAYAVLHKFVCCEDSRAPIVKSIRTVFNMPVLELAKEWEAPGLVENAPEVYQYWTGYMPSDVMIGNKRIPLDGTPLLLEATRDPNGRFMRLNNYTKPMATARASLYDQDPDDVDEDSLDMALGIICDENDPDYEMAAKLLEDLGSPEIVPLKELFVEACVEDRNMVRYPRGQEDRFRKVLFEKLPNLVPGNGVPLPFAFPPIEHRLQQYLMRHPDLIDPTYEASELIASFPERNIFERLEDTIRREQADRTKNANGAYRSMSTTVKRKRRPMMNAAKSAKRPNPYATSSDGGALKRRGVLASSEEPSEGMEVS